MQVLKESTCKIGNSSTSRSFGMRPVLVFAGLLWLSGCAGVLTVSGQPSYDDYYGDNYNDTDYGYPDQPGIDDPQDYYFRSRLHRHGDWIPVPGFGDVWRPWVVTSWTPYTLGYWASSPRGWLWVSYEPFGDIVYHYGNWGHLEGYGWCWFPGHEWAPNHVDWNEWQDSVGWYPTPPRVSLQIRLDVRPDYHRYVWVSHRNFLDQDISRRRESDPTRLWRGAGPPREDMRGTNPTVDVVQRWTGKRVPQIQTQEVQRKTRRGEVRVIVPDQQTREHVRSKGGKVTSKWLAPKEQDKKKGKNKDNSAGKVNG